MRYSQPERMEIIRLVEGSELPVSQTLEELGIPQSTFAGACGRGGAGPPRAVVS
jgi:hypothetical protein